MSAPHVALTTVLLVFSSTCLAQLTNEEIRAEIIEWAIEPCMIAAVASNVTSVTEEHLANGVTRDFAAEMMVAKREPQIQLLAESVDPSYPWAARSRLYEFMLRNCLETSLFGE